MIRNNKIIQLSKPFLDETEIDAVREVFATGYLGMGKQVEEFESMLSKFFNRHVVCVSSGTSALHLSLEAIGISKGDEVLVQSLTFTATYQAIIAAGAIPVSCDINESDLTIDLADAERKISSKTKAIIPVHYSGNASNIDEVFNFANKYNLRVVEDAAHAFGSESNGVLVGSIGDITCFSFDPVKSITCGEGGAIVTNDKEIAERVKKTRFIGIERTKDSLSANVKPCYDEINGPGWRYHMNNINAVIGIRQLNRFSFLKEKRQSIAQRYNLKLSELEPLELLTYNYNEVVPYIYVVKLKTKKNYEVIDELSKNGIQAGFHYYPCHLQNYFGNLYPTSLPVTENIYKRLLSLPLHPELEFCDIDYVAECLTKILE